MALKPGDRIGGYEVEAAITTTDHTEVYQAIDRSIQRRVVIKTLPAHHDPSLPPRLQQEAVLLDHVRGAYVVQLRTFTWDPPTPPYLVMEYLQGPSLQELISPTVDPDTRWSWTLQVAEAVAYVHGHNIVHRDLKPANVMLDRDKRLRLIDLDAARDLKGNEERLTIVGSLAPHTPQYRAPENPRLADRRYDVFSTGVVIAEIWLGHHPWLRRGMPEEEQNDYIDDPTRWQHVVDQLPSDLAQVIRRATAPNKLDRHRDGAELLAALKSCRQTAKAQEAPKATPATLPPSAEDVASTAPTVRATPHRDPSRQPPPPRPAPTRLALTEFPVKQALTELPVKQAPAASTDRPAAPTAPTAPSGAPQPPAARLWVEEAPEKPPVKNTDPPATPPPDATAVDRPPIGGEVSATSSVPVIEPTPSVQRSSNAGCSTTATIIVACLVGAIGMFTWRFMQTPVAEKPESPSVIVPAPPPPAPPAPTEPARPPQLTALDNPFLPVPLPPRPVPLGIPARKGSQDPPSRAFEPLAQVRSPSSPYAMHQHEVTWSELGVWCEGRQVPGCSMNFIGLLTRGYEHHPAHGLPRQTAQAYCQHLQGDLPTEAEWEWAARGNPDGTLRPHPWGSAPLDPARTHALLWRVAGHGSVELEDIESVLRDIQVSREDKGWQDVTPTGLRDMAGNALEWTDGEFLVASPATLGQRAQKLPISPSQVALPVPVRGLPLLEAQVLDKTRPALTLDMGMTAVWRHMRWDGSNPSDPGPDPYATGRLEGVGFRCVKREP